MTDTAAAMTAQKRVLKARGMIYQNVARGLGLSEASVKRLFSGRGFTLERLERVCALMDLSLSDGERGRS